MIHPSRTSAFLVRTVDFESDPIRSLIAREEFAGVAEMILLQGGPQNEEAQHEQWVFVALNTFDLAISSLFTLYGESAPTSHWWRILCISQFEDLAEEYPRMKQNLLWFCFPWQHSKESAVEKMIRDTLNGLSEETDRAKHDSLIQSDSNQDTR